MLTTLLLDVGDVLTEVSWQSLERLGVRIGIDYWTTIAEAVGLGPEWSSSYRTASGEQVESRAGEFWTMRDGRLIEWHAYNHRTKTNAIT
jgi:hypothetical protein